MKYQYDNRCTGKFKTDGEVCTQTQEAASRSSANSPPEWAVVQKIRGKLYYFGRLDDPESALQEYLKIRDDLQGGRIPQRLSATTTLADICNAFLTRIAERRDTGDISPRTFADDFEVCKLLIQRLGRMTDPHHLTPADFVGLCNSLARQYALSRLTKSVTVTKMVFTWAYESDLIDRPPKYGPDFRGASRRAVRQPKMATGKKLFAREEIRKLLDLADQTLHPMILLGINGGMGNSDIAGMPFSSVDTNKGWIDFAHPKTGFERRVPLGPETQSTLKSFIADCRAPKPIHEHLFFVTGRGNPWGTLKPSGQRVDQIVVRFRQLARQASIDRKGMGFYWLRHTFQTIGDEAGDPIAASHVMGHADGSISAQYREQISDDRLNRVVKHVHEWLFGV